MLIVPTAIMLAVTYTSLVLSIRSKVLLYLAGNFNLRVDGIQLSIAVLLLVLGVLVVISCAAKLLEKEHNGAVTVGT